MATSEISCASGDPDWSSSEVTPAGQPRHATTRQRGGGERGETRGRGDVMKRQGKTDGEIDKASRDNTAGRGMLRGCKEENFSDVRVSKRTRGDKETEKRQATQTPHDL